MKVWITKYALTDGIYETEATEPDKFGIVEGSTKEGYLHLFHKEGRDWNRTKECAIICAENLRTKRIASFEKSIKKLQSMTFE